MRRQVPIRVRVAAAFAVAMALVLVGTGLLLYFRLGSHLATALDRDLRLRADDLSALVRHHGSLAAESGTSFVEHGEAYAQLLDRNGRVVDATRPLGRTPLLSQAEVRRAERGTLFANRSAVPGLDEPSRLLATPVDGRVLLVGITRMDRAEALASLRNELLIAGPIALLLATLAGYSLAGLALRPVEAMRRRAAAVSADKPGDRLPVPATGDELERLGETLNSMLERLEVALERERDFVADAGHELRTPLALLRTELELALRHGSTMEELRDAVRSASGEADRLVQLAEDLLLIARTDKGELPLRLEPLEVSDLLGRVASRYEWRVEEAGRRLEHEAPPNATVVGDRLRLEQALGNLVDNALRHGAGTIRIEAEQSDGTVELHVRDEGPGFSPEFLPRAFERFTRPNADRAGRGAGLGLSIVRTIASAHGGTSGAANGSRGADVWIGLALSEA
jgi:signal transduction histidine kinase